MNFNLKINKDIIIVIIIITVVIVVAFVVVVVVVVDDVVVILQVTKLNTSNTSNTIILLMKYRKCGVSQSIDHNCPLALFKEPSSAYSLTTPWIH